MGFSRIALLDLGTNSLRVEIVEPLPGISPSGRFKTLHHERHMPRLGEELYRLGALREEAKRRTCRLFEDLAQTFSTWEVDHILAASTAAMRDAPDGAELLETLSNILGVSIRVLSGDDEARLTALGILANEPNLPDEVALVDVGGGSTELSRATAGRIIASVSLPLGALRLNEQYLGLSEATNLLPDSTAIEALQAHVDGVLKQNAGALQGTPVACLIGSSGTVRTLCRMSFGEKEADGELSAAALATLVSLLSQSNFEETAQIRGMERNRADIILAGSIITQQTLRFFDAPLLRASQYSLRHGLLEEFLGSNKA
ncbi:MAG: hypothetical protein KDD69_11465 [Bdellovibrionales bacterium]|nr:hypothetical protein [Bdellovibrionales bacterium]